MADLTVRPQPCVSCPYRRDAPPGLWAEEHYNQLEDYDGSIAEQAAKNAVHVFCCHNSVGTGDGSISDQLCAGWVGTHGAPDLLALRLAADRVAEDVWDYTTDVPLFESGEEAAAHGLSAIDDPPERTRRMMEKVRRLHAARNISPEFTD